MTNEELELLVSERIRDAVKSAVAGAVEEINAKGWEFKA